MKLKNTKITLGQWSMDVLRFGFYYSYKDASYRTLKSWHKVFTKFFFFCDGGIFRRVIKNWHGICYE